jgi:hypothetical protein
MKNITGSRASSAASFTESGEVAGTVAVEFLACPSPFACPDPLAADAPWVPFPNFPPSMPIVSRRLTLVE